MLPTTASPEPATLLSRSGATDRVVLHGARRLLDAGLVCLILAFVLPAAADCQSSAGFSRKQYSAPLAAPSMPRAVGSSGASLAPPAQIGAPQPFWTNRGRWNLGLQFAYAVENDIPRNLSHVNLLYAQPQLGFIVRDFSPSRFPIGRFEVLSEGICGGAIHPGARIIGDALILRLDGRPRGRAVPLFDIGAGVSNTNISERAPELSGRTQFNPQGGFGLQYFLSPQRALVIEYRYMHLSNGGIQEPNHGLNSSLISVGFRWLRRPRGRP